MAKILQIGLGPIAQQISKYIIERNQHVIKGAVDINPDLKGKSYGSILGQDLPITITDDIKEAVKNSSPDIAIVTTVSSFKKMEQTLIDLIELKVPVITTCEEMFYPFKTHPEISKKLNEMAMEKNVALLGTGVNPGLLMDTLPLLLTGLHHHIDSIKIERIQDASTRRLPFKQKIGYGLSDEEFIQKIKEKTLRHVGLPESFDFLADKLGFKFENVEETINSVKVNGENMGVIQTIIGKTNQKTKLELIFKASVNEPEPRDSIEISGNPGLKMTIPGAVHGDVATCSMVINCIESVLTSTPGLKTMADIPSPHWSQKV